MPLHHMNFFITESHPYKNFAFYFAHVCIKSTHGNRPSNPPRNQVKPRASSAVMTAQITHREGSAHWSQSMGLMTLCPTVVLSLGEQTVVLILCLFLLRYLPFLVLSFSCE